MAYGKKHFCIIIIISSTSQTLATLAEIVTFMSLRPCPIKCEMLSIKSVNKVNRVRK